jgi:hypothetical protein
VQSSTRMDTNPHTNENTQVRRTRAVAFESSRPRLGLAWTRDGIAELVRSNPLLAFTGAGALGAALGGLFFPRLGRLAFLVVAGYAGNELLQRQRALDVDEVLAKRTVRSDRKAI